MHAGKPLKMVNQGIKSAMLHMGRALVGHPRMRLGRSIFSQDMHQTGFANTCFATEKHHLAHPQLGLFPSLAQQSGFLLSANKRCQPCVGRGFKTALGTAFAYNAMDGD